MFSCGGKRCGVGTDVGNGVTEGKSVGRGVTEGDGVGIRVGSSVGNGDEGKGDGGNVGGSVGTGVGVFLWFLCLIQIVDRIESKLGHKRLFQLNRLCGVIILSLGCYLMYALSSGKGF